ncbi:MAG: glycosyltransferase family 2 protein [Cyanobacteria bacterium J06648_1]
MKTTVIIPSYKRCQDLERCLMALKQQTSLADEVIVVVRDTDLETQNFLSRFDQEGLNLRAVEAISPGQIAALNAGLDQATGDIIAITDDDGVPHPPWLERIKAHFLADEGVGGVGGRDWVYIDEQRIEGEQQTVGKVQWFGRTIGNHHLGVGKPREVEILKGANMSYRRTAIANRRFDTRLLGSGAEVHNDRAFSLNIKKAGWKLIYDPAVSIDHHHGKRFDEDQRGKFNKIAWFNEVHNNTIVMFDYLPPARKAIYFVWSILIGTRKGFGIAQLFRFLPKEGMLAVEKWIISLKARIAGYKTLFLSETSSGLSSLSRRNSSGNV